MKLLLPALLLATAPLAAQQEDVLTTAAQNGSFDTLVSLVVAAGLDDALQGEGPLTVFAPTDEAFAKLGKETLAELRRPENKAKLAEILTYHVLPQFVVVPDEPQPDGLREAPTLQGANVRFTREGREVYVNDALIAIRNVRCSNGWVQAIDQVLLPPAEEPGLADVARADGRFGTLLTALEAAGLTEALASESDLTILAPTDDAFAALPDGVLDSLLQPHAKPKLARILKDHVLPGRLAARDLAGRESVSALSGGSVPIAIERGALTLGGARVLANDVEARNGVIHVIDSVILLEENPSSADVPEVLELRANWKNSVNRDGVRAKKLVLRVAGGGSIDLTDVQADEIETRIAGGGRVSIAGRTGRHDATVNGGAKLEARDLVTHVTDMTVNGGGNATVNAVESLSFRANSGATVRYVKTDARVEQDVAKYANVEVLEH